MLKHLGRFVQRPARPLTRLAAHIEDVVVDSTVRGKGLGKLIITKLVELAEAAGCYKVVLDCSEANVGFYKKCGFEQKEVQMACYF